jgi:hypothetical protein
MRVSRSVLAVGGVVLAAGLITFTNPKAVHAVAAALVEVTNTASNPVVTQTVGQQASQNIALICSGSNGASNTGACYILPKDGSVPDVNNPYVVPANESLVVTAADVISPSPDSAQCNAGRYDGIESGDFPTLFWQIVSSSTSLHFTYPSGVVFGPSSALKPITSHYDGTTGCGLDEIFVYGYVTAS